MNRLASSFFAALLMLGGCSGGGGGNENPPISIPPSPPPPPPPPSSGLDTAALDQLIANFSVDDLVVLIGDGDTVLYSNEKGTLTLDTQMQVASASKIITGIAVWQQVEAGVLDLDSNPQDFLPFWTNVEPGGRGAITLDQLLGFTSGMNYSDPCIGNGNFTLLECAQQIYDRGLKDQPGTVFNYAPSHMQFAIAMLSEASGRTFPDILREDLLDPLNVSGLTKFPDSSANNPRAAGGLLSTPNDFRLVLSATLDQTAIADLDGFLSDRTSSVIFGTRPSAVSSDMRDWHYGFGFWIECDAASFQQECATNPTISSPGLFGFTPWIDFERSYWGIVAFEEAPSGGFSPSAESVTLAQDIQEIVEQGLN